MCGDEGMSNKSLPENMARVMSHTCLISVALCLLGTAGETPPPPPVTPYSPFYISKGVACHKIVLGALSLSNLGVIMGILFVGKMGKAMGDEISMCMPWERGQGGGGERWEGEDGEAGEWALRKDIRLPPLCGRLKRGLRAQKGGEGRTR